VVMLVRVCECVCVFCAATAMMTRSIIGMVYLAADYTHSECAFPHMRIHPSNVCSVHMCICVWPGEKEECRIDVPLIFSVSLFSALYHNVRDDANRIL
jgi:hypothetical protein